MALDDAACARIAPYVSSLTDDVFALSGLPEEVIAVLFAYYSRSRDDLRTNLAKLLADQELDVAAESSDKAARRPTMGLASAKARAFHEKWVVGYGHASVAEHAVVHLAIENASIIASKAIEDLRLGSYTEKSTRYVVFDQNSFVDLPELDEPDRAHYRSNGERLFTTYLELMPKVMAALRERSPKPAGTSDGAYAAAIRAQACDLLRGLLPAGTRTNLGLTANARAMEMLLSKMLSSPLEEIQRIAREMHAASLHVTPTLVKYAAPNAYRAGLGERMGQAVAAFHAPEAKDLADMGNVAEPVRLLRHDTDALERIALTLAYDGSDPGGSVAALVDSLHRAGSAKLEALVRAAVAERGRHDAVPRGFEASSMTVELLLDYGAYRDLQRHRMLSPATQRLTCLLGFETPRELGEMGFAQPYEAAMRAARDAWEALAIKQPLQAQYAVPLGYRIRVLWTLNLREIFHVVELRSARQGHISYRRMAQELYRVACSVHPWLSDMIRVDMTDYELARG